MPSGLEPWEESLLPLVEWLFRINDFGIFRFLHYFSKDEGTCFCAESLPPEVIRAEELDELMALHREIDEALNEADPPSDEKSLTAFGSLEIGLLVTAKAIVLALQTLACAAYYRVPQAPFPGVRLSALFDPNCSADLRVLFSVMQIMLGADSLKNPQGSFVLGRLYGVMARLFGILAGLLCEEPTPVVAELRSAYMAFHSGRAEPQRLYANLMDAFVALSGVFLTRECQWEARLNRTARQPEVVRGAQELAAYGVHQPKKRGKALKISVEEAASIYKVSVRTIKNWDAGKGTPHYYRGRNWGEEAFRMMADSYHKSLRIDGHIRRQASQSSPPKGASK
ncbi:MAG: hypothetical protein MJ240_04585 [Kiritimatiellae bacterium]|nr:hypothetical protein [Kiritimatiellia bacterium]